MNTPLYRRRNSSCHEPEDASSPTIVKMVATLMTSCVIRTKIEKKRVETSPLASAVALIATSTARRAYSEIVCALYAFTEAAAIMRVTRSVETQTMGGALVRCWNFCVDG